VGGCGGGGVGGGGGGAAVVGGWLGGGVGCGGVFGGPARRVVACPVAGSDDHSCAAGPSRTYSRGAGGGCWWGVWVGWGDQTIVADLAWVATAPRRPGARGGVGGVRLFPSLEAARFDDTRSASGGSTPGRGGITTLQVGRRWTGGVRRRGCCPRVIRCVNTTITAPTGPSATPPRYRIRHARPTAATRADWCVRGVVEITSQPQRWLPFWVDGKINVLRNYAGRTQVARTLGHRLFQTSGRGGARAYYSR